MIHDIDILPQLPPLSLFCSADVRYRSRANSMPQTDGIVYMSSILRGEIRPWLVSVVYLLLVTWTLTNLRKSSGVSMKTVYQE